VSSATRCRWTCLALTPAELAGTGFSYPGGVESWVDLGGWLYTETVTHPSSNWAWLKAAMLNDSSSLTANTLFTRWSWLHERSTSSFVNVCNITPFKWPDSQLIKSARRALVEPASSCKRGIKQTTTSQFHSARRQWRVVTLYSSE